MWLWSVIAKGSVVLCQVSEIINTFGLYLNTICDAWGTLTLYQMNEAMSFWKKCQYLPHLWSNIHLHTCCSRRWGCHFWQWDPILGTVQSGLHCLCKFRCNSWHRGPTTIPAHDLTDLNWLLASYLIVKFFSIPSILPLQLIMPPSKRTGAPTEAPKKKTKPDKADSLIVHNIFNPWSPAPLPTLVLT